MFGVVALHVIFEPAQIKNTFQFNPGQKERAAINATFSSLSLEFNSGQKETEAVYPVPPVPLEVLGVQLCGDAQDAVVDGRDVGQFVQLRLPVDEGLPQTV